MADVLAIFQSYAPSLLANARVGTTDFMIRCPHPEHKGGMERTPSCSVRRDSPVYFCHGCKNSGHVSRLLALKGVAIEVTRGAFDTFSRSLEAEQAKKARRERGAYRGQYILPDHILDEYGAVPKEILNMGFHLETCIHFGIGFDTRRLRITFPLRNVYGQLVGLSGRTVIGEEPRYKIYRHELIEDFGVDEDYRLGETKRAVLWNGDDVLVRRRNRGGGPIVIVEGFKAAMWVWQAGFPDVVALVGSYLTKTHANMLLQTGCSLTLFLDNDDAGRTGTDKAARMLWQSPRVRVAQYPDGKGQPDDLSVEQVHETLNRAKPYLQWRNKRGISRQAQDPHQQPSL